jgi:hypothetical protein
MMAVLVSSQEVKFVYTKKQLFLVFRISNPNKFPGMILQTQIIN